MSAAYLGYEIDSSAAKRAAVDLDTTEKSAGRAERGQKCLASTGKQSAAATGMPPVTTGPVPRSPVAASSMPCC